MPVYNGERFLGEALASLLGQSHSDFELIVSDNASTDRTADILRAAAARDPRIRCHRQSRNIGAAPNFDFVLEQAGGELFMWAACDDLWHPAYVESLTALLRESPDAVLAFCDFDNVDEIGAPFKLYPHLFDLPSENTGQRLSAYLAQPEDEGKANLIYGLMRRETLVRAGGMRSWSEREWGADMLVVFRLLSLGALRLHRECLFHKRVVASPPVPRRGGVRRRLGEWHENLRGWQCYFEGYERLIEIAEDVEPRRRAALQELARARYRDIRRAELRTLRRNAGAKIEGLVRRRNARFAP